MAPLKGGWRGMAEEELPSFVGEIAKVPAARSFCARTLLPTAVSSEAGPQGGWGQLGARGSTFPPAQGRAPTCPPPTT